jgi:DNA uptake protein ComE-like DNA-binding protein
MLRLIVRTLLVAGSAFGAYTLWKKAQSGETSWPPDGWAPDRKAPSPDAPSDDDRTEDAPAEDASTEVEAPEVYEESPPQTGEPVSPEPPPSEAAASQAAEAPPALHLANAASQAELAAAGVSKGAVRAILRGRPFASMEALAHTRGIGPKTMAALRQ